MLLTTLTLSLVVVPAPPQCPWQNGEVQPIHTGSMLPLNASFWVRSYSTSTDLTITDMSRGSTIAFDRIEIDLTATGGTLIQLRPEMLLAPMTTYQLGGPWFYQAQYTTTSTVDLVAPDAPLLAGAHAITSPYEVCQTAGIIIDVGYSDEPVIHLLEDPDLDTVHEIGSNPGLRPNNTIPTAPSATVRYQVVAVDLAGNRSEATQPASATAGATPMVMGKLEVPGPGGRSGRRAGGCTSTSGSASWLALWLGLALFRLRRKEC